MTRGVFILSTFLVLCLFSCVACAKNVAIPNSKVIVDERNTDNQVNNLADNQVNGSESTKSAGENKSKEIYASEGSTPPAVNEQLRKEINGGISIITKSDNIYTDAQKLETLNQLTGEIDKLIESLNNLEDVPDSELTFN